MADCQKEKSRYSKKKSVNNKTSVPQDVAPSTRSPATHSPGDLVEVPGARKIWGTVKATSSSAISSTLKRLTSAGTKLFVKKKKVLRAVVKKWWFIVRGKEEDLVQLQDEWEVVNTQTKWKIEKVSYYSSNRETNSSSPTRQDVLTISPIPITPTLSVAAEPSVSNLTTQARVGAGVLGEPSLSSQKPITNSFRC